MCLVATEDALSESVALKMLRERAINIEAVKCLRKQGFGYLKQRIPNLCDAAGNGFNVFVLTDLDQRQCAASLMNDWFANRQVPDRLLFRVAVREVEAWIMADRQEFAEFLGISSQKIPADVEGLADPKRHLLRLAGAAKREVRRELVPRTGSLASQGFGYNDLLAQFVVERWSSERAAQNSASLNKAIMRLNAWSQGIPNSARVL
jgi:hypothetical protein